MLFVRPICALLILFVVALPGLTHAQIDDDQVGAWYMYFFDAPFKSSQWGAQGDIQYRSWDLGGDLEQLLLRGALTWRPKSGNFMLTLGYAHLINGEFGSSSKTKSENRVYQDAVFPQKIGKRVYLRHRFRFEQRWVEDQDFRTRYRYALFMNIPLNQTDLKKGAWYLSFYNEVFLNGERDIGDNRRVDTFDRNWLYGALGYSISDKLRVQAGYMKQKSDASDKGQLQLSLHQNF
ncbi:MAG: DUF2490 domain-containing protein [Gammaproteobacteria bacterium]|nr:DUF2490 domain-containing protein [Gammaproteobacteria bacterium]